MTAKAVIVVGGGLAGLTAGYWLNKTGWHVTVLEASDEVGGRVRTVRKQGYTLDIGATQMSSGYREYLALCDELGWGDQMIASSPYIGLLKHGQINVIDGRSMLSGALTPALSARSKLKLLNTIRDAMAIQPALDIFDVSRSHVTDVESATAYAKRRLNQELLDVLVDPLIRAYVMNNADHVSALEWFSALKNLGGQTMLSLKGGNDRLPKALAEHMDVRLNTRVIAVTKQAAGVEVIFRDASGAECRESVQACVMAARLPETMAIYPPARVAAGEFGKQLRYNRAWVVQIGYRKPPNSKICGLLLPSAEQPEIGLLWLEHNKNPDRAPPGHALFSIYSDESSNDSCYSRSDAELIRLATEFVEQLFPELNGQQDLTQVTRWPAAIPNPAPGLYKAMATMKARLIASDPVQLAGDFLTCTGQNSAIYYGKRAAENIIAHQT